MENGTNGHSDYSEKRFDFYEIDWSIENFCVLASNDQWVIRSPEFTIKGVHTTTWLMTLHCAKGDSGDILRLTIKRSLTDAGPDMIWVDWRSSLPALSKEFCSDSLINACDRGMSVHTDLGSVEDVVNNFSAFESDSLTIRSKIIFYCQEDEFEFDPCPDSGVKALSDKLLQLLRAKVHNDLKLKFEDKNQGTRTMPVHKVVVCSRIKELNYMLETTSTRAEDEKGEYDVLDLSGLNFDATIRILEYAYSGNLKFVFLAPTFDIYDCVNRLQISELKPFFIPDKLVFRTFVDSQEFNFTWIISDVNDLLRKESISSALLTDGCSGKVFQIHFAPEKESCSDFYGLHIEVKEGDRRQSACFECAIANENKSYFFRRSRISTAGTGTYGVGEYFRRNMVKYFADEKCLKIIVRLRFSNGSTCSRVEKHEITFTEHTTSDKSYELLWNHMQAAYETGFFSDAKILVSGAIFRLHKSILYARCAKLYLLLKDGDKTETLLAEVEPRIFHMTMKYLYTGIIYNNENEADVIEIYDLAVKLHLSFLRAICSTFMRALIPNNPSIRGKVAEIAERHKDEVLLKALEQCVSDQEDS